MKSRLFLAFIKKLFRQAVWAAKKKTIRQILPSRCRRVGMPEYGRFTPRDLQQIIMRTDKNIKALMPHCHDLDNLGNYLLEYGGLVDLAIYRALLGEKIDPDYAMNLVGDMIWQSRLNAKGVIPIYDPLRLKWAKLTARDPMAFLGKRLKDGMQFPYSKPGYTAELYKDDQVFCMDFYSCSVHDFYKQFGPEEMTLFRKTWCTFDYSVAEHLVEGGRYRREHTLSDGDGICDMRWFIGDSPETTSS